MAQAENLLKEFGMDPFTEAARLAELGAKEAVPYFERQVGGYETETVTGKLVSDKYSYWFDSEGRLYDHPDLQANRLLEAQIDKFERGGVFLDGLQRVLKLALANPGQLIALYSPTGPATFPGQVTNKFSSIKKYDYGQLYLYVYDGEKIEAVAVSIGDESDYSFLAQVMPEAYRTSESGDIYQRIISYLLQPVCVGTLEDFVAGGWDKKQWVFTNRHEERFTVGDLLGQVRDKFTDQAGDRSLLENPYVKQAVSAIEAGVVTSEIVFRAYLGVVQEAMIRWGVMSMSLAGSCGGNVVTLDEINGYLGVGNSFSNNSLVSPSIFSSEWRMLNQVDFGEKGYEFDREGECQRCHKRAMLGPCGICEPCDNRLRTQSRA